ncbi:M10 family metallopeptidase C-terminal domain-containing protein [Methylobacterium sp. A54F]
MASQVLPQLNADALKELVYISGFNADGTVAAITGATYNATTRAYDTVSSAFKWGGGAADASGNPTGPNPTAGTPGGVLRYAFSGTFSAAEQQTYRAAMQAWQNVADVQFVAAADAASADFTFRRNSDGKAFYTSANGARAAVGATQVTSEGGPYISVDMMPGKGFGNWAADFTDGGNAFNTAVHEIGHLLGLNHGGPYNEGEGTGGAGAPAGQYTVYDQSPYTLMSYVAPSDANARLISAYPLTADYGTAPEGARNQPATPQILDILAIQRIYGAARSGTLTQAQTFGFNTTITDATRTFFDFAVNRQPVVTLYDTAATGSALDLSGFSDAATVDLTPGAFSSAGGLRNNIAIAFGTLIDTVVGGSGSDRLSGTKEAESFRGGAGNDTLSGGAGTDTAIYAGARADYAITLTGSGAVEVRDTRAGTPDGTDTDTGIEKFRFADGTFTRGQLLPDAPVETTVTTDASGGRTLTTSDAAQVTAAQGTDGVDQVRFAGAGTVNLPSNIENVVLTGAAGSKVRGNIRANVVSGNEGDNEEFGGAGEDTLLGGEGDDTLFGNQDGDQLYGDLGFDTLYGGQGADVLHGGDDDDHLQGDLGFDTLFGNVGDDLLFGNRGSDVLYGGQDADTLYGGQGDDVLSGDLGDDVLSGDLGADRYVFDEDSGRDLILGFSQADGDRLDFQGQTYTVGTAADGNALLTLSGGGTVELAGIRASAVTAAFLA